MTTQGPNIPAAPSPADRWPEFAAAVAARLDTGRREYGDESFTRDPAELLTEVEQELYDVAGWAFIAWARLQRTRARLARLEDAWKTARGPRKGGGP